MKGPSSRLSVIVVLGLAPAVAITLAVFAVWSDIEVATQQLIVRDILAPRLPLVVLIALMVSGLATALAWRLTQPYLRDSQNMADAIELSLAGREALQLKDAETAEMRALGEQLARLGAALFAERNESDLRAARARDSIERERNQLAALVADVPQSVIACNREGRVLLYNARARALFGAGTGAASLVGLGRPLAEIFDRRLLAHTQERLLLKLAAGRERAVASFITSTVAGRLVRVRINTVLASGDGDPAARLSGYILIADDVTRESEQAARRDQLLETLTQTQRAGLAGIRAAAENLIEFPDMEAPQRERMLGVLANESARLAERINSAAQSFSDVLRASAALEDIHAPDLLVAAQRRIEARTGLNVRLADEPDANLWLRADSFALIQVVTTLAQRVQDSCEVREVSLALRGEGDRARLELSWTGTAPSTEAAIGWEVEPMTLAGESSTRSIREVLARHDGELVYGRVRASARAYFLLVLPRGTDSGDEVGGATLADGRPEYYDFDLFAWSLGGTTQAETPLAELAYTVFDTETTGLDPAGGDEIIQFGALRIVNGRLLNGERFAQLVDPRRDIDPGAEAIHGISREQLHGQPGIETVLPAFHAFARGTVLLGHNAAFDMRFLQLKEASTGLRFDQPVLDTLLLSAVLHPNQEGHSLEAIAERFGLAVVDRHDAVADALLTGQLFLRMIPLLAERGIHTLADAREASQKTYYARLRY